jgi:hypothetical protein
MSHGGKGDTPRPLSVDQETFANNWEAIFGKKKQEEEKIVKEDQNGPKDSDQEG